MAMHQREYDVHRANCNWSTRQNDDRDADLESGGAELPFGDEVLRDMECAERSGWVELLAGLD